MRDRLSRRESSDPSTAELVAWRRRQLQRAGFEVSLANKLASDGRFDLHAALELIDRGCPPGLAARILAPLDDRCDA
jgi:hypothetical protein